MTDPETDAPDGLRIAHLTTVDMSLALLLATELRVHREAGHTVFGISAPGRYVERVEALGVRHVPIRSLTRSWSPLEDLRAFVELVRTLRRLRLDVLHTHTPKAGVMGRIAGRLARVPVVVNTCHGLWARPEDPVLKRALVYGVEALAIRFSDFELFQNAEDAHTLRRFLKPGRWKVVGNGIDLDRFRPDPEGRRRVRAELGIADKELLVGSVGRRVGEKGLGEFCEAAHLLRDRATFIWVGPEDETEPNDVTHADAVGFVGERTDMPAVYSALDVFVLASHREGFSRASMEAAACGAPIVLSDIRGCREIGTNEEHVLLVPPRNTPALAAAVRRLLDDLSLRLSLGSAARARSQQAFDQREVARASLAAYESAAAKKGGGREVAPLPWSRKGRLASRNDPRQGARLTVLHVLPQDMDRGAQVYAGQLRDRLSGDPDQRHLVVTLFQAPEAAARADVKLGVRAGLMRRAGLDPRAALRLHQVITADRADLVVAHGGEALKYVVAAADRTTTLYYKVGLSSAEIARPLHRVLYRYLSNRVDLVVGVSRPILDQVRELFCVPARRTALIPNGRDPRVFRPLASGEHPDQPPRLLFVGRFEEGKRPELFLDAVEELRERGMDLSAAMAGDGPLRSGLERRAAALSVDLLGVRKDIPQLLRRSAVLVVTSAAGTEGMPGVLVEAGLSGVPVVSTPAAGVADILSDGATGIIVDQDTPEGLAASLAPLLEDAAVRQAMGTSARERCLRLFTIDSTAELWRELTHNVTTMAALKNREEEGAVI